MEDNILRTRSYCKGVKRRTRTVSLRLNEQEFSLLNARRLKETDLTMGEWIREVIVKNIVENKKKANSRF